MITNREREVIGKAYSAVVYLVECYDWGAPLEWREAQGETPAGTWALRDPRNTGRAPVSYGEAALDRG